MNYSNDCAVFHGISHLAERFLDVRLKSTCSLS